MKLHRAGSTPEWASIPVAERNLWQRLAARTNAVITPGNILTALGLILVCIGAWMLLSDRYTTAFICIAVGRFLDIADGWTAEKTKTKSPLGESLDASFDKLAALVVLVAFAAAGIAPFWLLALVLLPHLIISVVTGFAFFSQHKRLHPSRLGKISGAIAWLGLLCLIGNATTPDALLRILGYLGILAAAIIGFAAAWRYSREASKSDVPSA